VRLHARIETISLCIMEGSPGQCADYLVSMTDPITCGPVAGVKLEHPGQTVQPLLQVSALAVVEVGA
jgi:hypothetical protein